MMLRIPVFFLVSIMSVTALGDNGPMPPKFTLAVPSQQVLGAYPLGVLSPMGAYSHHGHPDHKITLPNRLEGWVYEVHGPGDVADYRNVAMNEDAAIAESHRGLPQMSYTLVFSVDGKVVDVLYDNPHGDAPATALQIQRSSAPKTQKLPGVEHGQHFPPGGESDRY